MLNKLYLFFRTNWFPIPLNYISHLFSFGFHRSDMFSQNLRFLPRRVKSAKISIKIVKGKNFKIKIWFITWVNFKYWNPFFSHVNGMSLSKTYLFNQNLSLKFFWRTNPDLEIKPEFCQKVRIGHFLTGSKFGFE